MHTLIIVLRARQEMRERICSVFCDGISKCISHITQYLMNDIIINYVWFDSDCGLSGCHLLQETLGKYVL